MSRYGVKVSRIGFDVNTASDKQLAFSSEWPLLPIEAEGEFTVTSSTPANEVIYAHNLNYVPVFRIYYQSDFYDSNNYYLSAPHEPRIGTKCCVNNTNLLWNDVWYSATPMKIYWKLYRRDMLQNYDSESFVLTDQLQRKALDYGIFISKRGKEVLSSDVRDFAFRSDKRPLIISNSKYTTTPGYSISITHNLGYRPMYWVYYQGSDTNWYKVWQNDVFKGEITSTDITFSVSPGLWGDAANFAIITFKSTINDNG